MPNLHGTITSNQHLNSSRTLWYDTNTSTTLNAQHMRPGNQGSYQAPLWKRFSIFGLTLRMSAVVSAKWSVLCLVQTNVTSNLITRALESLISKLGPCHRSPIQMWQLTPAQPALPRQHKTHLYLYRQQIQYLLPTPSSCQLKLSHYILKMPRLPRIHSILDEFIE